MSTPTNRKLKVWSAGPRGTVMVFQDGTSADGDVTSGYRFDDAFRTGAQEPDTTWRSDRTNIFGLRITSDTDTGPTLTFKIQSPRQWWYNQYPGIAFQPNDRVELFANAPTNDTAVLTPAWHLNNQSSQVRIFHGWVEQFDSQGGVITVTCRSALWKANDVRLVRDGANGITIPKIAFNVEKDSADYFYSVKKTDTGTYGVGSPVNASDQLMTVKEILEYLEDTYADDLQGQGVIPASSIWSAGDLTGLTSKPGPIILEGVGFTEGVSQILTAWAPDVRVQVDPRTSLWRIVRNFASFKNASTTLTGASSVDGSDRCVVTVASASGFSETPGEDGYYAVLVSQNDPGLTHRVSVYDITGSVITFNEAGIPAATYTTSDLCLPMQGEILPTLALSFDSEIDPQSLSMAADLRDVYSAINITSVNQKTESRRVRWNPIEGSGGLAKGWDEAYESFWKSKDEDRERDHGRDGSGIAVYKTDTGGSGGKYRLYLPYAYMAYLDDHVSGEWNGASLWVLTADNVNARESKYTFTVTDSTHSANIGDGRPGMVFTINETDFFTEVGGTFWTELTAVAPDVADKVGICHDFAFATTTALNRRWEVGRKWYFTVESYHAEDPAPHQSTCKLPQFTVFDSTGRQRQQLGLNPNLTYPPLNVTPYGAFETLATGGLGAHHVWRRAFYTQTPAVQRGGGSGQWCDRTGWSPPDAVEATWETTTTEIRAARYPVSGFDGMAYRYYGLERCKEYTARHWFNDSQDGTYDDLAFRLWNAHQRINYRGQVTAFGAAEFLAWIDLGIRVGFTTQMFPAGGGGILVQFWGVVQSVDVDFEADRVTFTFDADNALKRLALEVFEDISVKQKSENNAIAAGLAKIAEIQSCYTGSRPTATSPMQCDDNIAAGPRNVGVKSKVPVKDNINGGLGETGIAAQTGTAGGTSTHGANAWQTSFRDLRGNHFLIGSSGEVWAATYAAPYVTSAPGTEPEIQGTPWQAQQSASGAASAWGLIPQTTPAPIFSSIVTAENGGGNTTFNLLHTGLTIDALIGGKIQILDYDENNHRPEYEITDNTASAIIVSEINEDLPGPGSGVTIWYKPSPEPNATDWPNGGLVCKDLAGGYCVVDVEAGEIYAATYNGTTNEVELETEGVVVMQVGPTPAGGATIQYAPKSGVPRIRSVGACFDGGAGTITDESAVEVVVPFAFTLKSISIVGDTVGSATVNIQYQTFADYGPGDFVDIHETAPEIVGDSNYFDDTLTGFETEFDSGTVLRFIVDGVVSFSRLSIVLTTWEA